MATARPNSAAVSSHRPASSSSSSSSVRPFSSTNLSATVANARFKSFSVQQEILSTNALLCAIAKEIPWKNLLDLFTLKFFAVGDVLFQTGAQPLEIYFILCGGFLVRHAKAQRSEDDDDEDEDAASSTRSSVEILAEKMLKPGQSMCAYAVDQMKPLPYTIVTAKFKSILVALPRLKFRSILKQVQPSTKLQVLQLIEETEAKLLDALKIKPLHLSTPTAAAFASSTSSSSPSKAKAIAMANQTAAANLNIDMSASWASLQAPKPVEYEVNSSILILHEPKEAVASTPASFASSTASAAKYRTQQRPKTTDMPFENTTRWTAKKHTTRRLQNIKLPATANPFPKEWTAKSPLLGWSHSHSTSDLLNTGSSTRRKECMGRLLSPLKKPAMYEDYGTVTNQERLHPTAAGNTTRQHVLVLDRRESFRAMAFH